MRCLATERGVEADADVARVRRLLGAKRKGPLWLDIQDPEDGDYELLRDGFGIHQLTLEDIQHGGQRPKWEDYPKYTFLVLMLISWGRSGVSFQEQFLCMSPSWVVSVHRAANPALDGLRHRLEQDTSIARGDPMFLTYLVCDAIVDSAFPVLDQVDDDVDALEDRLVSHASQADLEAITELKHSVTDLRRVMGAQRDSFQRLVTQSLDPQKPDASLYFRDVYDHLVRQYETVDSLRDLLSGAMDTYLSTVSNRLNGTMKTLTVVASLFLPLTFLTGFFGMNFGYLVRVVQPSGLAFALGIVLMVGSLVLQLYLFRRRGWI